jgi:nitrate/TMAO reductase-like tetraheme cytochrome c subunit
MFERMPKHVFYRQRAGVEEPCAQSVVEAAWIDMQARGASASRSQMT